MSDDTTIDDLARSEGIPLGQGLNPSMFDGAGTAPLKGLATGVLGKPALLLGDAVTPMIRPTAQAADAMLGTSFNKWLTDEQNRNKAALNLWKPDPITTGFAGQVVHSLFDLGGSAMVFGPASTGVFSGYSKRQEQIDAGIDPTTATEAGAVSGAAAYVGLKLPITLGKSAVAKGAVTAAGNVGYGAGSAVATSVVEQGTLKDLLSRNGYKLQADAIDPFDTTSLAAQAALGGLFSGGAAAIHGRATAKGQNTIDAALAINRDRHAAIDTAPGIPATPGASAAHAQAMEAAGAALMNNEPVNVGDVLAGAEFLKPKSPGMKAARAELDAHVADLKRSTEGELPQEPARSPAAIDKQSAPALPDVVVGLEQPRTRAEFDAVQKVRDLGEFKPEYTEGDPRGFDIQSMANNASVFLSQNGGDINATINRLISLGIPPSSEMYNALIAAQEYGPKINGFVQQYKTLAEQNPNHKPVDLMADAVEHFREANILSDVSQQYADNPAMYAALDAMKYHADVQIAMEDGSRMSALEAVNQSLSNHHEAKRESKAFEAAVNCFLRTGI